MRYRIAVGLAAVVAALLMTSMAASAFDDAKYPDLSGQWVAVRLGVRGQPAFDPTKPWGRGQQAPLTPEYQAIFETNLAALRTTTVDPQLRCLPAGTPRMMIAYEPLEFIVTAEMIYIRTDHLSETRRIHTDGDGKYDVLEIETRFLKGPRALDPAGMPTHEDNNSIVKERIYFDKAVPSFLHNEITLIDNAYTRPWTVLKTYRRAREKHPDWPEDSCDSEGMVMVGKETYFRSADGALMPTNKDQPPPDLRYFPQARK